MRHQSAPPNLPSALVHAARVYSWSRDLPSWARAIPTCTIAANGWEWLRKSAIDHGTVTGTHVQHYTAARVRQQRRHNMACRLGQFGICADLNTLVSSAQQVGWG
jgi:hypothetical protein